MNYSASFRIKKLVEAAFRLEVGRTCLWFNYEVKNWNSQPQSEAHKKINIDKSWKWHKIGNGEENCSNNSWVITSICCTFALSLSTLTPCHVTWTTEKSGVCGKVLQDVQTFAVITSPFCCVWVSKRHYLCLFAHATVKRKYFMRFEEKVWIKNWRFIESLNLWVNIKIRSEIK